MAKCRECGAEYQSSSETCFACEAKRDRRHEAQKSAPVRYSALIPGIIILAIGAGVAVWGAGRYEGGTTTVYDTDWESVAAFGVFIASVGIGTIIYPLVGRETPAWMLRKGGHSRNGLAVAMVCFGAITAAFIVGYTAVAAVIDVEAQGTPVRAVAVTVAAAMVALGYSAWPRTLLTMDGFDEAPRKSQLRAAAALAAFGVALQVSAFVYAYVGAEPINVAVMAWLLASGTIAELASFGSVYPQGRAWVSGGTIRGD